MNKFLSSILLCLITWNAHSQTFSWAASGGGTSGDYGNSIAVDASGNSYVTGWFQNVATFGSFSLTSSGGYDLFLIKYNSSGIAQWAVKAGGTGNDIGYGIDLDASGNIFIAGAFSGTATFGSIVVTGSGNPADIFVVKYDMTGTPVWVHTAGSASDDQGQAIAVDQVSGKIFVGGYFKGTANFGTLAVTASGQSDVFVACYDNNGSPNNTPLWVQKAGGSGYDNLYGMCTDLAGNVYLTGYFSGTALFGAIPITSTGSEDIFVAKYNTIGNLKWVRKDGGTGIDRGLAVTAHKNSIYYTGWFLGSATFGSTNLTGAGLDEIFVAKVDTGGSFQWARKAGGTGYDQGYGICTDLDGIVYVTGAFDSSATFGTNIVTSNGAWDVFVTKLDPAGNFFWTMTGGGNAFTTFERDIGYSIRPDDMQNLYVAGIIRNTATFGTHTIVSVGIQDVFVAKISPITTAIHDQTAVQLRIYPNPSSGILIVSAGEETINCIEMFNGLGQMVYSGKIHNQNARIETGMFPKGLYHGRIYLKDETLIRKIIIQ